MDIDQPSTSTSSQSSVTPAAQPSKMFKLGINCQERYITWGTPQPSQNDLTFLCDGGQKQCIAIARAIVRKPRVLLLDEATSALDAESEHLVQKALYENLSGYTVLLIAHRLSTVRRVNRIIVIDKGRVVQQGSHDQLMQQDDLYKNLVQRQLLGECETKEEAGGSAI